MPFQIIRNDITKVSADAIVNTANPEPVYASGTDYAVYMAAGAEELLAERRKIGRIRTGEAAATPAFRLPAKYIIHTVGPVWLDGSHGEYEDLSRCYRNSLMLAKSLGCESIAFPLISAGIYGFPKDRALDIALKTTADFLEENEMDVTLVVFNKTAFDLSAELVRDVRAYIDDHYVEECREREYSRDYLEDTRPLQRRRKQERASSGSLREEAALEISSDEDSFSGDLFGSNGPVLWQKIPDAEIRPASARHSPAPAGALPYHKKASQSLSERMGKLGESFQERLFRLIDERGLNDTEVYKKANIDRKLFSKIRCKPDYSPTKRTAVALAIALGLNLDETIDLLGRAGLALSPSSKSDLIVQYCIDNRIYDIFEINALLFEYDQPLLGC